MIHRSTFAALEPPPPRSPGRITVATMRAAIGTLVDQRVPPAAIVWAEARDGHRETRLFLFEPGASTEVDEGDPAFTVALRRCELAREVGGRRLLVALHTDRCTVELPPVPHPHHETTRITILFGTPVRGVLRPQATFEFAAPVLVAGRAP